MRRWMVAPLMLAAALGMTMWSDIPEAQAQGKGAPPEVETIRTADGMKLQGLFHATTKPKTGSAATSPTVLFLYPPGVDRSMAKGDWESLANTLNAEGFNVFRFDWRGHGKSTDILDPVGDNTNPGFWTNPLTGPWNTRFIRGSNKRPPKNDLFVKEISPSYFPMYVQDLAAVRQHLDVKNDQKQLNSSSLYVIASEDAAALTLLWLTAEWNRPSIHPVLGAGEMYIMVPSPGIRTVPEAGNDIAGAIFLSGSRPMLNSFSPNTIQAWIKNTLKIRDVNPMLFLYGDQDSQGKAAAKFLFEDALVAEGNKQLGVRALEQTFMREVKGGKGLRGVALLGQNGTLKTEDTILAYLNQLEKERGNKVPLTHDYKTPYYINVTAFGVNP